MTAVFGKPIDLVLAGGGVKGIGLVGAVVKLMDAGYRPYRVAGTSAGSVVGAMWLPQPKTINSPLRQVGRPSRPTATRFTPGTAPPRDDVSSRRPRNEPAESQLARDASGQVATARGPV
jgi:hypothetical protein